MARKKTGVATIQGSKRARQVAVAVLETLAGELSTSEAAQRLGVCLSRYYQLETRALAGLLAAVEPRAKGPRKTPEGEIKALLAEKARLEKELRRHQALLRAAHRSVGLPQKKRASSKGRAKAKRRPRGEVVLQTLRRDVEAPQGGSDGGNERDAPAGGRSRGE
jgi:hypothetical protein